MIKYDILRILSKYFHQNMFFFGWIVCAVCRQNGNSLAGVCNNAGSLVVAFLQIQRESVRLAFSLEVLIRSNYAAVIL